MDFPSHIRKTVAVDVHVSELDTHLFERIEPKVDTCVIIYPKKVKFVIDGHLDLYGPGKGELDNKDAGLKSMNDRVIVKVVGGLFNDTIERVPFFPRERTRTCCELRSLGRRERIGG